MIIYFSATGNSRYVANMIADICGDTVINSAEYIKSGKKAVLGNDRPLVFVSPVYVSALPRLVDSFMRESEYVGNRKAYFIMTCAGGMGASPIYCEHVCTDTGLEYMGTAQIEMPQNYLVFFKTKEKNLADMIVEKAQPAIRALAERISNGKEFDDPGVKGWELKSTEWIIEPYYRWFMGAKAFRVSDDCIGCGLCAKNCALNNIVMSLKKPVWGDHCTHCMACINLCPKQAIEYGKWSVGKPRYKCPDYTAK